MDEQEAHKLYMNMREQGSGAAMFKSGLGFTGRPG